MAKIKPPKLGKPPTPIDWKKVELFLKAGCTQIKIAESLGIHSDTLRDRAKEHYGKEFSTISSEMRSTGHVLLEAKQFDKAMQGNMQMLIWLGKIRLGQREPDSIEKQPVHDNINEIQRENMLLKHALEELKAQLDGNKRKTR